MICLASEAQFSDSLGWVTVEDSVFTYPLCVSRECLGSSPCGLSKSSDHLGLGLGLRLTFRVRLRVRVGFSLSLRVRFRDRVR